jgi:hypothetical protein
MTWGVNFWDFVCPWNLARHQTQESRSNVVGLVIEASPRAEDLTVWRLLWQLKTRRTHLASRTLSEVREPKIFGVEGKFRGYWGSPGLGASVGDMGWIIPGRRVWHPDFWQLFLFKNIWFHLNLNGFQTSFTWTWTFLNLCQVVPSLIILPMFCHEPQVFEFPFKSFSNDLFF